MAENKTKPTESSVAGHIAAISDELRRKDCEVLAKRMAKATKCAPKMWGSSIVGFGSYHYKYESGREGESCLTGFSSRGSAICLYLTAKVLAHDELVAKLGKHKVGKGCLYVRALADVDLDVLDQLVVGAVAERKQHYD